MRAVHVNRARRTRTVRGVREHLGTRRLNETHGFELADFTVVDARRVDVVRRRAPCGSVGGRTEVVRHVWVDEAHVVTVERSDVRGTQLGNNLTDVISGDDVLSGNRGAAGRVGRAASSVHHVGATSENFTDNLVNRVASVVANDVGGGAVNVEERGATQLGGGHNCVAVLVEGDGHLAVGQCRWGDIRDLVEGGRRRGDVGKDGERDARTWHCLLGWLNVCGLVEQEFRTQREIREAVKCNLVYRQRRGSGLSCHDFCLLWLEVVIEVLAVPLPGLLLLLSATLR